MKKSYWKLISFLIRTIIFIVCVSFLVTTCKHYTSKHRSDISGIKTQLQNTIDNLSVRVTRDNPDVDIHYLMEKAYFEGQKDALREDIRIEERDGGYVWIKSPWDSGTEPKFIPPTGESELKFDAD